MLSTTQNEKRAHLDGMLSTIWLGVFPADRLPSRITQFPRGLVANTDPSTKPGMHWVAMYFPDASTSEFFDSYGFPPSFYSPYFEKLLGKFPISKTKYERFTKLDIKCVWLLRLKLCLSKKSRKNHESDCQ